MLLRKLNLEQVKILTDLLPRYEIDNTIKAAIKLICGIAGFLFGIYGKRCRIVNEPCQIIQKDIPFYCENYGFPILPYMQAMQQ